MNKTIVYSIIESPGHPDFSSLYREFGWKQIRIDSMRKAISQLRRQPPDVVVAEFFYGYGNNYAGINISNLDVFLHSLLKYAPQAKIIVMVEKAERPYVARLADLFALAAILVQPVSEGQMRDTLDKLAT
ncbi:hypothetical protein [Thiohalophilus sp.]|uniref:hypothetical protein n=1 Tax=Thiohalophilus sp. TaxID=3028392 RepID=UPI0039751E73